MNLYIVVSEDQGPVGAYWTRRRAEEERAARDTIVVVELDPIGSLTDAYFQQRGLVVPDPDSAKDFLVSEVGELVDAWVHRKAKWVRNDPGKARSIQAEAGDVLMMAVVFAHVSGFDLLDALLEKLRSKGFDPQKA